MTTTISRTTLQCHAVAANTERCCFCVRTIDK